MQRVLAQRRLSCSSLLPVAVIGALVVVAPALAQHAHQALPPAATEIHPGLGDYHFPITTTNPEAQVYFDQGIRLLYGFNHDEAARYFRRATELDPQAAMPYWGLALSIGPNYNDAAVDAARAQATFDAVGNAAQRAGLIRYARGHIEVLDRPRLEQEVCECYAVVKKEFDRLLTHHFVDPANTVGRSPS